VIKLTIAYLVH